MKERTYPVIIPAAGIGSRMNSDTPKQYLKLNSQTVIEHTIEVFIHHPSISKVIVALHPNDSVFNTLAVSQHSKVVTAVGGKERVDSVLAGLNCLSSKALSTWVLVHDAARPCVDGKDVDKALDTLEQYRATHDSSTNFGGIFAHKVVDTVKRQKLKSHSEANEVDTTLDRDYLWCAQTPQIFQGLALKSAIETSKEENVQITDEASAMERVGTNVLLLPSSNKNLKITLPSDLSLAEFYLSQ